MAVIDSKYKHIWLIEEGVNYTSTGWPECVCKTKEVAMELCKNAGYTYSKKDDLWCDADSWRTIGKINYFE